MKISVTSSSTPEKKTDQVRDYVSQGDYKSAMRIAKGFRMGFKEDIDAIRLAWECMTRPHFYEQIGKNPEDLVQKGMEVLDRLYGKDDEIISL